MVLELHHLSHRHLSVALSSAEVVEPVATTRITTTARQDDARTSLTLEDILAMEAICDRCREQAVDISPDAMLVGGASRRARALKSRAVLSPTNRNTNCCRGH